MFPILTPKYNKNKNNPNKMHSNNKNLMLIIINLMNHKNYKISISNHLKH